MLWTYAPSEPLDPTGLTRSICGSGGGGLQMDRLQRVGPLLRSAGTRSREDSHQRQLPERHGVGRPRGNSAGSQPAEACGSGSWIQPVRHHVARPRSNVFRGRDHRRASGAGTRANPESDHHLASERQGTRGRGLIGHPNHSAPLGSRHIRDRRDRHRSKDRIFSDHRQRQLLRSTAVRIVSAAQVDHALAAPAYVGAASLQAAGRSGIACGR
jgi:hypothetical protein